MAKKPTEENPKPRIGRKEKKREFSKQFQKKFQRKRKRKTHEQLELPKTSAEIIAEHFREGRVGSNVHIPRELTDIADRLAILSNQLGIEETAELLGVDFDGLENVLQGQIPTSRQKATLEHAYTGIQLDEEVRIDFDEVEQYAKNLAQAILFANEVDFVGDRFKDTLRYSVANQQINIKRDLENHGQSAPSYYLFADGITPAQKEKIFEYLLEGNSADEMFEAYNADRDMHGTIWFDSDEGMAASFFWAWFRETFYP